MNNPSPFDVSTPTPPQRALLSKVVSGVTVVVALFGHLHLVVPFLLAWAFWGLIQRSDRAGLRWVAWPLAIPTAHYLWRAFQAFVLQGGKDWAFLAVSFLLFSLPLVWLYRRPSKAALWVQAAVSALLLVLAVRLLAHFVGLEFAKPSARSLVADVYFYTGSLGAALLTLYRSRPQEPPPATGGEPVSVLPTV